MLIFIIKLILNGTYALKVGVDFALKVLKWDVTTIVRLQLWDIAGLYKTFTICSASVSSL